MHGDEETALKSIHSLFPTTRDIIKQHGRKSLTFTKLAIVVLNQIIRPFTALQADLRRYTGMLGEMAGVEEDLMLLEQAESEKG